MINEICPVLVNGEYLPDVEKRIARLRDIIGGRPVAILAAGPSIRELENRIHELRNADICYFGFNRFVQETCILHKIDKNYSLYADPCCNNWPEAMKDAVSFLERPDDNMFISAFARNNGQSDLAGGMNGEAVIKIYDKKLIFFSLSYDRTVPNKAQPLHFISGNTLQMVIQMAIIGKASKIVLFGADGGNKIKAESDVSAYWYNYSSSYGGNKGEGNVYQLLLDTSICFNPIMPLAIRNIYKTYDLLPIEILNCSKHSFYSPFPIISYDDAFKSLLIDEKVSSKSDLRMPKTSIITLALDANCHLKEIVENVMEQIYPNFEYIIVHNNDEGDDGMFDMKRRFPQTRWVHVNGCNWQEGIRKGIAEARGENIYYLHPDSLFANSDWLNICMDILENHLEISLVWGLSQELSDNNGAPGRIINKEFFDNPPLQGREFIDCWLKKKPGVFGESFCVRKTVLEACLPLDDDKISDERAQRLSFNYNFNTSGYLPFFVPLVANYNKKYFDQGGHRPQGDPIKMYLPYYVPIAKAEEVRERTLDNNSDIMANEYHRKIRRYRNAVLTGRIAHRFRDGFGEELKGGYSWFTYFVGSILRSLKRKVPHRYFLFINRTRNVFKNHRWGIFKVGMIKISDRLIRIGVRKKSKQKDLVL